MDEVPMCRMQVVEHSGAPATEARARLFHDSGFDAVVNYVTDRVGRLQFAFPDASTRVGVCVKGGGVAVLTVPEQGGDLRVELSEAREVRGRVVGEDGEPKAGAVVFVSGQPQGMQRELGRVAFSSFGASAPTGDDGRYVVTLPLRDVEFTIRARWRPPVGAPMPKVSRLQKVAPDVREVELVVR